MLHGFPYSRVFYNGVSSPPRRQQSYLSLSISSFSLPFVSRRRGGLPSFSPGPSRPSVYLTDPSLTGTPCPGVSYGSFMACLHHKTHRRRKDFLTALTRLLVMIGSLPHCSHAHRQLSVPVTLQQTISSLSPICRSGTSDTWWSEAVATPPTYTLYISLASGPMLPKGS